MTSRITALTCNWRASKATAQATITQRVCFSTNASPQAIAQIITKGGSKVLSMIRYER